MERILVILQIVLQRNEYVLHLNSLLGRLIAIWSAFLIAIFSSTKPSYVDHHLAQILTLQTQYP